MLRYASAEPTCTIVPRSRGSIRFSALSVPYTTPRYVTSVTRLYSSAFISLTGEKTEVIALFTQISMGPNCSSTFAAAASTASASATSVGNTSAEPPAASISRFAPSSPSTPRANNPTLAPLLPKCRAMARPSPADAPVTTTTSLAKNSSSLDNLPNFVFGYSFHDFLSVLFSFEKRFGKMHRLIQFYMARHWRLVFVDKRFNYCGTVMFKRSAQCAFGIFGILNAEPRRADRLRIHCEIDRFQIDSKLRISVQDHLLPFDLSQRIVLDNDDLYREFVLDQRCHLSHQHGEAAVADYAHHLPSRKSNCGTDAVRQSVRHARKRAGERELHVASDVDIPCSPGRDRAAIARDDRIVIQQPIQLISDNLGFHRQISPSAVLVHHLPPFFHSLLRGFQEAPVVLTLEQRDERHQHGFGFSYEAYVRWKAQTNARAVEVDLYALHFVRLRIEVEIWKAAAHNEQSVTFFHRILRRCRPKQADSASSERAFVRNDCFPQQRLYDRRRDGVGQLRNFLTAAQSASAYQNRRLRALIDDLRSTFQKLLRRMRVRSDIDIFTVLLHVHVGTLIVGTLPFLNVFRNRDMGHSAMTKRGANGFVDYVMDMGRSHDALVVSSNIHVQLV